MKRRSLCAVLAAAISLAACQGGAMQSLPAPSAPASGESTRARGAKPHHVYSPGCNQPPNVPIGTITEYVPPVPSVFPRQPAPQGIIVDPVGGRMVLFEDPANNVIGTFGPVANQWNKVPHLTIAGGMGTGITAAPNAIWYTGTGGYVFRLDTSPLGYPFGFPVAASKPGTGIDAAPDGHIYIASTAGQIAVLNPKSLPAVTYTPPFAPEGVTTDSSSNAWYTTAGAGKILEEQPAKPAVFKQFKVPSGFGGWGITEGPPGTGVWFTEVDGNRIGNVTASGTVVEYPLPTAHANPTGIVAACGNLWFTETGSNKIGEITPTGKITEFKVPSAAWTTFGSTQDIAADANGLVWFTEAATGKIASIQTTATVVTTPTPSPTPTATPVPTPTPTPVPTATPTPIATPTPNPYSGVVMADRPSMYFHLDGPLTGTLTDVSGNANYGTVNGALSIAGAIFGWSDTAFELSGGDMYGYYEPTVAAFSVETWLKTTTTATNDVFDGDAGNCPNIFDVRVSDASNAYVPVGVPAG